MTSLRSYQIQSELMLFEPKVALELSPEGLRSLIFFRWQSSIKWSVNSNQ